MRVLPSLAQMESLTRPLQRTKIPRGAWPSTNRTAPLGYAVAYLMVSNDCSAEVGRSQKMRSTRILQVRQLSIMSRPYGESTVTPPCDPVRPQRDGCVASADVTDITHSVCCPV